MGSLAGKTIDIHFHVGLLGDSTPRLGAFSAFFKGQLTYKIFLAYARLKEPVSDRILREATERIIESSGIDHVVCLALDAVYDDNGNRREELSHMWVDNQYVVQLRRKLGGKVLLGASVHPYDPKFEDRVKACVDEGAVLLKWLPSAQRIDLADERALSAMKKLACLGSGGRPLPLLLHIGGEYAIPPAEKRLKTHDFHSWSRIEGIVNRLRGEHRWEVPKTEAVRENIMAAARDGAIIIFAHCGLPYFFPGRLGGLLEHSDFRVVSSYLNAASPDGGGPRRFFADVSACCIPSRKGYFPALRALPRDSLFFGSDCPTPVFELSAGHAEHMADFKAALAGDLSRVVIPEDNPIDVSYRELFHEFPAHRMFTNFGDLVSG